MKKKLVKAIHDRVEKMNQAYVRGDASIFDDDEKKQLNKSGKRWKKGGRSRPFPSFRGHHFGTHP